MSEITCERRISTSWSADVTGGRKPTNGLASAFGSLDLERELPENAGLTRVNRRTIAADVHHERLLFLTADGHLLRHASTTS
jgi:hypothetical protein